MITEFTKISKTILYFLEIHNIKNIKNHIPKHLEMNESLSSWKMCNVKKSHESANFEIQESKLIYDNS